MTGPTTPAAHAHEVIIYSDGGCRGNPGVGGWAFLAIKTSNGQALERCGGETETTNNRMELMGAIMGLRALQRDGMTVLVHSDSQYVVKAASQWISGWKARGWKRKEGPLKNLDLLQQLDELLTRHRTSWEWVRGHDGNPGNERVDVLANEAMDRLQSGSPVLWERRCTWKI